MGIQKNFAYKCASLKYILFVVKLFFIMFVYEP